MHPKSGLRRAGWFRSFRHRRSVDGVGSPIPWWTYAAVEFVEGRIGRGIEVLEFGSGASTFWLAQRVCGVKSIENDAVWAGRLESRIPSNVELVLTESMEETARALARSGARFHLLINDALADRIACARESLACMTPDGVILWDNTDGPNRPAILQLMHVAGYRELGFSGPTAQEVAWSRTSVFYRPHNVLGI